MRSTIITLLVATFCGVSFFLNAQEKALEPITAGEFSFSYDKPWIRQAVTSRMRAGQLTYKQSDEKLKNVDVVIFYFGAGPAGGIEANLKRWAGQFTGGAETKTEKKKVNDREIIYFTGKGTFQDSVGGPFSGKTVERPNHTMLAAILPSEKGPVFLKMTGPNDSVAAAKDAFVAFAESPLKKKEE